MPSIMNRTFYSVLSAVWAASVVQAAQSMTVCSAGECLTGTSNITRLGAVLSSASQSYILLPGQYTSTVQPASLEQALSSATSTITFTTGFSNSTTPSTPSLPLTIALQPGLLNYPNDLFSGDPQFYSLPQTVNATNAFNATSISRGSIILSANTVAAIQADNNGAKSRVILWDTVPYISQLPYAMAGNLEVLSIQSSSCSPACSSSATCSTSGTCICPPNFTGDSCEQCANGFFGPDCKPCPTGCSRCDSGITGTGACLAPTLPSAAPSNCNCANGQCTSGGTCTCSTGWTTSTTGGNTVQCNICADGFFLDSNGNCEACGSRCQRCAPTTGACTQCDTGLVVDSFQPQTCGIAQQCANGQFPTSTGCSVCNSACATCNGPAATDCLTCAPGTFFLNGQCVGISTVPASGVCQGSQLVANSFKGVCDTCPLGCSNCSYAVFSTSSVYSDVRCTKCLPGKFLSGGSCVDTCPDGTFANSDGTCTACSSSCGTCVNSATFCLTCKNQQLASAGSCVSSCPSNSFSSSGTCTSCHPDCASCSGPGFNQCLSCPANSPVLTSSKRCVTTCAKTEYFDQSSGSCKSCDSSCGSCSAGGSSSCLSCASNTQVLRGGKCVSVNCGNGEGPTSGLGACLAELVQVPSNSGTPPVSIPPIDPNASQPTGSHHGLTWWQILLIVLGILILLALILLLWRRRQRKKRQQQTEEFKQNMKAKGLWGRLWRNPFAGWWARRRSAMLNRRSRSDVERMTERKDWRNTQSDPYTPGITTDTDRRTAVGVPKSIGRGSWVTTGDRFDGRSYFSGPAANHAALGLGAIREGEERDRFSERNKSRFNDRRYGDDSRRGESEYYARSIDQDDSRTEITHDPFQFPRPSSRNSDDKTDLISMIKSEVAESDRYDDRERRLQYERSRSGYGRSERSYRTEDRSHRDERSYRQDDRSYRTDDRSYRGDDRSYRTDDRSYRQDDRSLRQDYPASVSTQSQSRRYDRRDRHRDDRREFGSSSGSHGPETPSMYSQPTLPRQPPPVAYNHPPLPLAFDRSPPTGFDRVPLDVNESNHGLSSRFSLSTKAPSTRPKKGQGAQPSEAEMYKLSKLFPDWLMSPTKKETPQGVTSPSRNPFRI